MDIDTIFDLDEEQLDNYLKSKNNTYTVNIMKEKRYLVFYYANNDNQLNKEAVSYVNKR